MLYNYHTWNKYNINIIGMLLYKNTFNKLFINIYLYVYMLVDCKYYY